MAPSVARLTLHEAQPADWGIRSPFYAFFCYCGAASLLGVSLEAVCIAVRPGWRIYLLGGPLPWAGPGASRRGIYSPTPTHNSPIHIVRIGAWRIAEAHGVFRGPPYVARGLVCGSGNPTADLRVFPLLWL